MQREPKLTPADQLAKMYPKTFRRPAKESLRSVQSGGMVKICMSGERFWVRVTERRGSLFRGIVDNDLAVIKEYKLGDVIVFDINDIYSIY